MGFANDEITDATDPSLRKLRLGITSFSADHSHPTDRRRFLHFARRSGLSVAEAVPGGEYDIVIVTQAADITSWSRLSRGRTLLIYDLTDSYLNVGKSNRPREFLRGVGKFAVGQTSSLTFDFRKAMAAMCRRADAVVCSTPEQAEVLRQYNPRVYPILDFTSVAVTEQKTSYSAATPIRIAWEGQGGNVFTLGIISEPLRILARERRVEIHLVTDLEYSTMLRHYGRRSAVQDARRLLRGIPTFFHEWHEGMLARIATACDLAALPLPSDDQLYWNKPENRLLLFWRMGLPTITTGSPAYERTMLAAGQPYYCTTTEEWTEMLLRLAANEDLRRSAGEGGRAWVEATWSEDRLMSLWGSVLSNVLDPSVSQPEG